VIQSQFILVVLFSCFAARSIADEVNASWSVDQLAEQIKPAERGTSSDHSSSTIPFASIDFGAYEADRSQLPIGVFDSGIGGLTVLEAILACDIHHNDSGRPGADGAPDFENERFIYLGDQANMPYGNYPASGREDYLRELIIKDSIFLLGNRYWTNPDAAKPAFDKPPVKAIVIACNTATAYGLEDLRRTLLRWNLPVLTVGVVEAGASAVMDQVKEDESRGAVAVLATMGTCNSGAYPKAIRTTAGRRGLLVPSIIQQGSLGLAGAIEGDPAFVSPSKRLDQNATAAEPSGATTYRGPTVDRAEAPIDPGLLPRYAFVMEEILGDQVEPSSWKINSIENYVRYDVTTLVENYRKANEGTSVPIRYVMLGCTHFPFEASRIEAAFSRLRSFRNQDGSYPYRDLIAEKLQIIDPAQLTAKDLFRQLFLQRLRAPKATTGVPIHQIFLSVPHKGNVEAGNLEQGWFSFDFKYGRVAGVYDKEHTKIVPLEPGLLNASSVSLLRSYAPNVCSIIGLHDANP